MIQWLLAPHLTGDFTAAAESLAKLVSLQSEDELRVERSVFVRETRLKVMYCDMLFYLYLVFVGNRGGPETRALIVVWTDAWSE